jgi:uncharacterized protein with NRDE domain
MCTIIVRHGIDDWCATIIASNRDEFYERPASGPRVLRGDPRVVGGRDEREGGTWFGLTPDGFFAGLTNQRNFGARDDNLLSRGGLVVDVLATGSLERAKRFLAGIDPRRYNDFNLIIGDGAQLCVAYGRRGAAEIDIEALSAGVHVLCNDRLGSPEFPKADKARERVASIPAAPWHELRGSLAEVLADRSLPDPAEVPSLPSDAPFDREVARRLQAIYVETPVYGTVSSTLAAVSPGRVHQYQFTDALPTAAGFEDMVELTR